MRALKEAAYRANMELYERGLVLYTWGNVSQADRDMGVMAIKPSGVEYGALTPDMMVVVSLADGGVVEGDLRPSSDAPTHIALYRAFPVIGGVAHTHSTSATAWAQAGLPIPALGTTHADYFHGPVPITRYLSPSEVSSSYEYETGTVIAEAMSGLDARSTPGALVIGHGPFCWGIDGNEAVFHSAVLEEIAKMAILTRSINLHAPELPSHISEKHYLRKHGANSYYGQSNFGRENL